MLVWVLPISPVGVPGKYQSVPGSPHVHFPSEVTRWGQSLCGPGTAGPAEQSCRVLVGCALPLAREKLSHSPSGNGFVPG